MGVIEKVRFGDLHPSIVRGFSREGAPFCRYRGSCVLFVVC